MAKRITVVMYHYVRPLRHVRFPGNTIKALDLPAFREQLAYLEKHYRIVTMEDLVAAADGSAELPPKAALLTFDDGYADHYEYVFPVLDAEGLQGTFFVPAKPILEHTVLDVNKIHYVLASTSDVGGLVKRIFEKLDRYRDEFGLESNEHYFRKLATRGRYDAAEVVFVKLLLQVELSSEARRKISSELLCECADVAEDVLSREMYMSIEQLQTMGRHGMHIGGHGYDHVWLNSIPSAEQGVEITRTREFLDLVGVPLKTFSYPYGAHDRHAIDWLRATGFSVGFNDVSHQAVFDLTEHDRYAIPRLDTNDIPKVGSADVNEWFHRG